LVNSYPADISANTHNLIRPWQARTQAGADVITASSAAAGIPGFPGKAGSCIIDDFHDPARQAAAG